MEVHKSDVSPTFLDIFWKVAFKFSFSFKKVFIASFLAATLEIFFHEVTKAYPKKFSKAWSSASTNGNWRTIINLISWYLALLGLYVKTHKPQLEVAWESWVWVVPLLPPIPTFHSLCLGRYNFMRLRRWLVPHDDKLP